MHVSVGLRAFFAVVATLIPYTAGLSASVCDSIQAEWQSAGPRLTGAFPYYTLLGTVARVKFAAF